MFRLIRLNDHFARLFAAAGSSTRLLQKLKRPLTALIILLKHTHISSKRSHQGNIRKIMSFHDHLGSDENICFSLTERGQNSFMSVFSGRGVSIHSQNSCFRHQMAKHLFDFLCPQSKRRDIGRTAFRTPLRHRDRMSAIMTYQRVHIAHMIFMCRHRYITMRTLYHISAISTRNKTGIPSAVNK